MNHDSVIEFEAQQLASRENFQIRENEPTEINDSPEHRAEVNRTWRNGDYKIFVKSEQESLTLPECYDRDIVRAKEIFNKVEAVANQTIQADKYLLFVDMANPGGMGHVNVKLADPDRLAKMYEAETGSPDLTQDFQSANMRYCFGFKPGDARFRTVKPFHESLPTNLKDCVGIILSGSEANIKDEVIPARVKMIERVTELVKMGKQQNIPMFGICFGSQLLSSIFRAEIAWIKESPHENDEETGLVLLHKTTAGMLPSSPLAQLPNEFYVHANHKQEVIKDSMPDELEILASSDTSQVQIVQLKASDMVLAIQNHIECGDTRADVLNNIHDIVTDDPELFQGKSTLAREVLCPYFLRTAGKYALSN